nr:hypothetical protein [Bacillaceae bacterium]
MHGFSGEAIKGFRNFSPATGNDGLPGLCRFALFYERGKGPPALSLFPVSGSRSRTACLYLKHSARYLQRK